MRILADRAASDGAELLFGGLFPVTSTVNATTTASDTSHPKMKAAPFLTPSVDASTRMNAVNGIGSRVIANPMRTRLKISMRHLCHSRHGVATACRRGRCLRRTRGQDDDERKAGDECQAPTFSASASNEAIRPPGSCVAP